MTIPAKGIPAKGIPANKAKKATATPVVEHVEILEAVETPAPKKANKKKLFSKE